MIKTIIFDFGDVLVRDTTKVLEAKYKFDNLPKSKQRAYIKAFHNSEVGKYTTQQLLKIMHETLAPNMKPKEIEEFIVHTKILPTWKLAQKLSQKYKVIIFSNNQKLWPKKIAEILGENFFQFPWINSAYIGMRKPDKQFYTYVLKKFKLKASECAFIDDKLKNITPALSLGFHAFQYNKNIGDLKSFLKKAGISV